MSGTRMQTAYVLKISLNSIEPEIWRSVLVPSSITLKKLHLVIQTTMGWWNYHLHQYVTQKGTFGTLDADFPDGTIDEARVRLDRLLKAPGDRISYDYDFGDGWKHEVRLEKVTGPVQGDIQVECLVGARARWPTPRHRRRHRPRPDPQDPRPCPAAGPTTQAARSCKRTLDSSGLLRRTLNCPRPLTSLCHSIPDLPFRPKCCRPSTPSSASHSPAFGPLTPLGSRHPQSITLRILPLQSENTRYPSSYRRPICQPENII